MGSLGDALHKAGLISEDDRKRQDRPRGGGGGGRGGQNSGGRGGRGGRGRGRGQGGPPGGQQGGGGGGAPQRLVRPMTRPEDFDPSAAETACSLIDENALDKELGGRKRWHYESTNGELPFVVVNDRLMRQLENGERALAQGASAVRLVDSNTAAKAIESDPSSVLFWTRSPQ